MRFTISREQILIPLQQAVSIIERKQTIPILGNVLMQIQDSRLILIGSDSEIQLISVIPVLQESEDFSMTAPSKKLLDICRLLPSNSEIHVELLEEKIRVSSGRGRYSLSTLPADDYPEFNETSYDYQFKINAGKFKKGLDKTLFCMANQDIRFYLNGLLLHISNSKIKLVASDGHRLSIFEDELGSATGYEARIIIPRKAVLELNRIIEDKEAELEVLFSANQLKVLYGNVVFSTKLIDAKFPDFGKVFNQTFLPPIHVQKELFKNALTRVAILSSEKFKTICCDFSHDLLRLTAQNPDLDEAEEEVTLEYGGEPLTIYFNSQYLLEALNNLDAELATINITANHSSCFIQEPLESIYKFIVMPVRM